VQRNFNSGGGDRHTRAIPLSIVAFLAEGIIEGTNVLRASASDQEPTLSPLQGALGEGESS